MIDTRLQDKYLVKSYAAERGVRAAATLYVTDQPEDIPFDSLPADYFIKASHGWAWNILAHDGQLFHFKHGNELLDARGDVLETALEKYLLSREECVALCNQWMCSRICSEQWAYQCMSRVLLWRSD